MKKIFAILLACFTTFAPINVLAEENEVGKNNNDMLKIQLVSLEVTTEFLDSQAFVNYRQEGNKYIAEIVDKYSGEIVASYSETPDIPIENIRNKNVKSAISTYDTTLDGEINLVFGLNLFKAYVSARVTITAGQSWRQIDKAWDEKHTAGSSGGYYLTGNSTYIGTSSFPTTSLKIDINGVIESNQSNTVGTGVNFNLCQTLGFNMSGSASSNWYARKTYNTSIYINVM
ncbi:hypothetical protein [Holdemania massiliensis]|uniref:hypothetical protein n=1 Tax=Holdemania massiliensis TaxID=1468449 RepID=UPI00242B24F2|nr:hypothetical protein [Holdemania massiliensis]